MPSNRSQRHGGFQDRVTTNSSTSGNGRGLPPPSTASHGPKSMALAPFNNLQLQSQANTADSSYQTAVQGSRWTSRGHGHVPTVGPATNHAAFNTIPQVQFGNGFTPAVRNVDHAQRANRSHQAAQIQPRLNPPTVLLPGPQLGRQDRNIVPPGHRTYMGD